MRLNLTQQTDFFFIQCDGDIQTNQKKKGLHVGMLSWNAVMKNGLWSKKTLQQSTQTILESEESSIVWKKKWFNWILLVEKHAFKKREQSATGGEWTTTQLTTKDTDGQHHQAETSNTTVVWRNTLHGCVCKPSISMGNWSSSNKWNDVWLYRSVWSLKIPKERCAASGFQTTCSCTTWHACFSEAPGKARQARVWFFVSADFYRFWN